MPFYLPQTIEKHALCYFTIMNINKYSVKPAMEMFRRIADLNDWANLLVNQFFIDRTVVQRAYDQVVKNIDKLSMHDLIVQKGKPYYPKRLALVKDAPEFLFLRGEPSLANRPVISVVGTRNPSPEGAERAKKLARLLSTRNIVVASGLAKGIDFAAHTGTFEAKMPTIAVIGTPLNKVYPNEHSSLQSEIGETGLVVSQFIPGAPVQRWNFPLRNATMSGISIATIVIEAGESSGALIQAREALKQKRKVFIPQSAINNPALQWPNKFVTELGASKFTTINDLMMQLQEAELIQPLTEGAKSESIIFSLR